MSSFTGRFPSSTSPSLSCCSCRLPSGHPPAYRIRLLVAGRRPMLVRCRDRQALDARPGPRTREYRPSSPAPASASRASSSIGRLSPLRPEADQDPLPGLLSRIVLALEGAEQGRPCRDARAGRPRGVAPPSRGGTAANGWRRGGRRPGPRCPASPSRTGASVGEAATGAEPCSRARDATGIPGAVHPVFQDRAFDFDD